MVRLLKMADEKKFIRPRVPGFPLENHDRNSHRKQQTKRLLPSNTVVGHKTGSSDRNLKGREDGG